jgi:cystathionine gamma-lyase/homocysteine desulfhydrase
MKNTTKSIHARVDTSKAFPAATPIFQNSAFESQSEFFYSRKNNPNVDELETAVKLLEGTKYGLATTTGMSAINLVLSLLKPGQKLLVNKHVYGCSFKMFQWHCQQYQIELLIADLCDDVYGNIPDVDMVFFETPTNPFLFTIDIEDVSTNFKAKNKDCIIVVDNTWATPLYQSPCSLGADISLHSATKYISGHSDVMGGILLMDNNKIETELRERRFYVGANLDPHSAWLLRRSLQTLEIRLEKQGKSTSEIATFLETRPEVERVYYPKVDGLQLKKYATLVFFDLKDALVENYPKFYSALKLFSTGTGMACVTSMVAQPYTGSHASMDVDEKKDMGLSPKTIRLSFGLEDSEDLITDLINGFENFKS